MNEVARDLSAGLNGARPRSWGRLMRPLVYRLLRHIEHGELAVTEDGTTRVFGCASDEYPLKAGIRIVDPTFFADVLFSGSLGACESYIKGHWDTDDLEAVIRLVVYNQELYNGIDSGWTRLAGPMRDLCHALSKNSRQGSLKNIMAHYDLGNDFFSLILDETMAYSCAVFEREDASLEAASTAKFDRICRKLELSGQDHVIEIGTGWGGFALHAAGEYGCRVTTTTISPQQREFAQQRIAEAGLSDLVTVLNSDYRDLDGQYDKLVSIEMIEAVGHHYLDHFFEKCSQLLRPDGLMALQAITIPSHLHDGHKTQATFINRYIFPGSSLPSNAAMLKSVSRRTDLRLIHMEDITPHYARTLREWRNNFERNSDSIRKFWPSPTFTRMWRLYFCYCEASFRERYNGVGQYVLAKPKARRSTMLAKLGDRSCENGSHRTGHESRTS
jgi:cyclopropane-fatty-acyl-phospholipid synthase